jgi:hypothetical protein
MAPHGKQMTPEPEEKQIIVALSQHRFLFSRLTDEIVVFLQTGCFLYPSKFKRLRTVLEEKQIIVALSQQGYSSYKIAEMTGKNRRTISKFLRCRRVRGSEENDDLFLL